MEQQTAPPEKSRKSCIIAVVTAVLLLVIGGIVFYHMLFSPTVYTSFNDERIRLMEDIFDITVTEDMKLIRYEDSSMFIAIDQRLTLAVPDYEAFLKQNLHAAYEPTERERFHKEDHLYYHYVPVSCRTEIEIAPEKDGVYTVTLRHYE